MNAYTVTVVALIIVVIALVAAVLRQRYVYASRIARLTLRLVRERNSYTRLITRYMAVCKENRRHTALQAAPAPAQPEEPSPYLPDFTTGALPEDLDEQFDELMHRAFIAGEEAR